MIIFPNYRDDYMKTEPIKGAPKFFKRIWDNRKDSFARPEGNILFINPLAGERLMIYGYGAQSEYEDDRAIERRLWAARRQFFAYCFSPIIPDGEPGFVPADEVEQISEEEFVQAMNDGWPQVFEGS